MWSQFLRACFKRAPLAAGNQRGSLARHGRTSRPRHPIGDESRPLKNLLMGRCGGALLVLIGAVGPTVCGCADDPYSQRRIEMRWRHFDQLANDLARSEAARPAKVEAAIRAVEEKWYRDVARFNDVAPQVGDYVW